MFLNHGEGSNYHEGEIQHATTAVARFLLLLKHVEYYIINTNGIWCTWDLHLKVQPDCNKTTDTHDIFHWYLRGSAHNTISWWGENEMITTFQIKMNREVIVGLQTQEYMQYDILRILAEIEQKQ